MNTLSVSEIKGILRSIVASWSYDDPYRINTFSVAQSISDYGSANFNKNRSDYDVGDYWTRDYSSDNDSAKSGFLTLELVDFKESESIGDNLNVEVWITVAHDPSNKYCAPSQKLSKHQLYLKAVNDLRFVLSEVLMYQRYVLKKEGEDDQYAWIHKDSAPFLTLDYDSADANTRQGVKPFIVDEGKGREYSEIVLSSHGYVGATTKIIFDVCESITSYSPNREFSGCESEGVVVCGTC